MNGSRSEEHLEVGSDVTDWDRIARSAWRIRRTDSQERLELSLGVPGPVTGAPVGPDRAGWIGHREERGGQGRLKPLLFSSLPSHRG